MLTLNTKVTSADSIFAQLVLPYELRENSRLRTALESGEEVAIFTERGTVLRNKDLLRSEDGRVVEIISAQEPTYRITCSTAHNLLRCAFHLGNRHTQTQVEGGFLRIYQDSVLKEMLERLGATVIEESAQFEPESGAYHSGGHHHHGDDEHSHAHGPLAPIPVRQKIHRATDPQS
ncbi:urease accessory protein [Nitrosomonas cryotolerans]|uniref:Urease accessory protein UreE n=1 Tax=Nitrosomonas cryotolerans ATCC 49181 TaxID=1131553 RepID=A0A1N6HW99_9PROT|nr:urease accessory protein UreE [Nitrosomonas cryotolerans]SFP69673.1 urease accessory protein [Nitrosomonas cryotolerans]SIO24104.1 urease accessory protein [Nitrosomonas cryotolerans ATCC 49181]